MKIIFLNICLFFITLSVCAQNKANHINFEQNFSWDELTVKAKKEKRFVFLDFNTSWCIPCRRMESEVFTKDSVAMYLNNNFICSSYRCDTAANDKIEIKNRFNDALKLIKELNIEGYPTYVVLNSEGEMVHKIVGYMNENVFLDELRLALHPETQYLTFVKEFNNGNRNKEFLLKLIKISKRVNDYVRIPEYINTYLKTQKNLLTKENIEFVASATKRSKDVGFSVLLKYPLKIDHIIGQNKTAEMISEIIFNEVSVGFLRVNGKTEYKPAAMMVIYNGEIKKKVNWLALKKKIDHDYPKFSSAIMNYSKITYYGWINDWLSITKIINSNIHKKKITYRFIENAAQMIISGCDDKKILNEALQWFNDKDLPKDPYSFWTKSDLLFKLGRVDDAISELDLHRTKDDRYENRQIESAIKKMKIGKNRWSD